MREVITDDLLEVLNLEEIDTNLYMGINETSAGQWPALFGGQVAAQALRAAAYTVPEGRFPHSFHGYFLRAGRGDKPVLFRVARDRDGHAFSARQVNAIQSGKVIFSLSASFVAPIPSSAEWSTPRPVVALPEDLPADEAHSRFATTLDIRSLPPVVPYEEGQWPVPAHMWVRTAKPLPDDPIVHACALAYASDVGSGFGDGTVPGVGRGGTSMDHAIWFHDQLRMDDWVLLDMWPLKAGGGRGLYSGQMQDRDGRVGAMLTQEFVFRSSQATWIAPRDAGGVPPSTDD